jgi:hypothetical protein
MSLREAIGVDRHPSAFHAHGVEPREVPVLWRQTRVHVGWRSRRTLRGGRGEGKSRGGRGKGDLEAECTRMELSMLVGGGGGDVS